MNIISSDDQIHLETHFKITAGPGAGKTHWLINHIRDTVEKSLRLEKTRKIACITYTNIAVDTILNRLGSDVANKVEVSTIHSFLYKHLVKPYLFLIAEEFEINIKKMNGHDDIIPKYSNVQKWLDNHSRNSELKNPNSPKQLLNNDKKNSLWKWLSNLEFKFDHNKEIILVGKKGKAGSISKVVEILEDDLMSYKKLFWSEGKIHHDDILFFSHILIEKYPFILNVLRAKFPYFFLDEVQDTSPIQASIIKAIAEEETIVGIIGDPAQSIFSFQGASIEEFNNFNLAGMIEYKILENRRSSNQIIGFLNTIRSDIIQSNLKNIDGEKPILFIGDNLEAYTKIVDLLGSDTLIHTLSRNNPTANAMKSMVSLNGIDSQLLNKLKMIDSNPDRQKAIINSIEAIEFAQIADYKNALEKIKSLFIGLSEKETIIKSMTLLQELLEKYSDYQGKTIMHLYNILIQHVTVSKFRTGAIKDFYSNTLYKHIAVCISYKDDTSLHRTIHKAKGDEFENVLLIPDSLDFIINPDLGNEEEHRVYYVALSRAKSRLFIVYPKILKKHQKLLEEKYEIHLYDFSKQT